MNAPFFLVATKNKLFLSHVGHSVIYKWSVSPEQLWYENDDGYIGAYGTDLMLIDPDHQIGTSRLMSKIQFDNLHPSGYTGKPKLQRSASTGNGLWKLHGPQMYSVEGASTVVHGDDDDHGKEVRTVGSAGPFAAVFRKIYAHDFLGCVHWDAAYHTTSNPNFVEEGLQAIESLGFGIAKVKVNKPSETYKGRVPDHDPASIVDTIEKVFKNSLSSFHTIILSVWSTFHWDESYFLDLEGDELEEHLEKEYKFFKHLTQYLEGAFENKTIVLQNWESDWKFNDIKDNEDAMDKVIRWIRARQRGVSEGRSRHIRPRSTKVLHALEVNKVQEKRSNNITELVLKHVDVDLVSYSMYEIHENGVLSQSLDFIADRMNEPSRYMTQLAQIDERFTKRVYLGEYGTGDEDKNNDILVNAISWGCPFALYWQVFENLFLPVQNGEGQEGPVNVRKTDVGEWFRSLLPLQGTRQGTRSADPVMGFDCVQPNTGECKAQLGGKYRTLADCTGQCHNAPKLGGMLPNLMQSIYSYIPFASTATNRDARIYSCAPTAFDYRTLRNPHGPCPPEASFQEPNSLCCSSDGSSQEYLGILRKIYNRSYGERMHHPSLERKPTIPEGLRRVLNWINHPDNLANFPTSEGEEVRLPMEHPKFKDIVKLVIMLTSGVRIVGFYENPADSRTYTMTEPWMFHTRDGRIHISIYPQTPVYNDIIDAINECASDYWSKSFMSVSVVLNDDYDAPIVQLPNHLKTSFSITGSPQTPVDFQDVIRKAGDIDVGRFMVVKSPTTVLDAFIELFRVLMVSFTFQNHSHEAVPDGYIPVSINLTNLKEAVGGTLTSRGLSWKKQYTYNGRNATRNIFVYIEGREVRFSLSFGTH